MLWASPMPSPYFNHTLPGLRDPYTAPSTGIPSSSTWQTIYAFPPEVGSDAEVSPAPLPCPQHPASLLCAEPGFPVTSGTDIFFRSPRLLMTEESRDDFIPLSCPPLLFLTQWQRCRAHSRLQLNREQQEGVGASASSTLKAEARRGFWPEVWT